MNFRPHGAGDPPVRIDYLLSSGMTAHSCAVYNGRCGDGTSISDHMGVQAELYPGNGTECAADAAATGNPGAALAEALAILQQGAGLALTLSSTVSSEGMAVPRQISSITHPANGYISACPRRVVLSSDNVIARLAIAAKEFLSRHHDSTCDWHACAGAGAYSKWKFRLLLASALLSAIAVIALGLLIAQPWWQYALGVVPFLAVVQGSACVAAALLFVVGMAGYGSVYHALAQTASDLHHLLL